MFSVRPVICYFKLAPNLTRWWKRHRLRHCLRPEAHHAGIYWPTSAVCLRITGTSVPVLGHMGTKLNTCWGLHPSASAARCKGFFFFSFIYFFVQSSATASHSVCYIQNADATQRAGILNWGRLSTGCMSMCYQMHLQHSRRDSEKMHHLHSTDGNLLKLKNLLNCWKRCAMHRGCQARWHLLAACTQKKRGSSWKYNSEFF